MLEEPSPTKFPDHHTDVQDRTDVAPVMPAIGRKEEQEFKAIPGYRANSMPVKVTQTNSKFLQTEI